LDHAEPGMFTHHPRKLSLARAWLALCLPTFLLMGCGKSGSIAADAVQMFDGPAADGAALADAPSVDAPAVILTLSRCVGSWPSASSPPLVPSLLVSPRVLWTRPLASGGSFLRLTGQHLVYTAGNTMRVLSLSGDPLASMIGDVFETLSAPVSRSDRVFVAGEGLYEYNLSTLSRGWKVNLPPPPLPGPSSISAMTSVVVLPDGSVIGAAYDGFLYRWSASGGQMWRVNVGSIAVGTPPHVVLGIGDVVFGPSTAAGMAGGPWYKFYDIASGDAIGAVSDSAGRVINFAMAGSEIGLVGYVERAGGGIDVNVVDRCGKLKWAVASGEENFVAALLRGDRLLAASRPVGTLRPVQYRLYSPDGVVEAGPVTSSAGLFMAGADGTILGHECLSGGGQAGAIVGYDANLQEAWRVDVPVCYCPSALADDGVLYRVCEAGPSYYLEAIQTPSPGLGRTSWPVPGFRDNSSNCWVAPY